MKRMRRGLALLIALLMTFTVCSAAAESVDPGMKIVRCPEQGFSTLCDPNYNWSYSDGEGVTIYTENDGYIPYAIVYQGEDLLIDAMTIDYIHENVTPYMQKKYGGDLVSYQEYDQYTVGGRNMPAAIYTYRVQGHLVDMLRAYDTQNGHTIAFTAKYLQGQGDATLDALDWAAYYFRPFDDYYTSSAYDDLRYETAHTKEGDMILIFDEVFITLPADWAGKYDIKFNERGVSFYHTLSRRLWNTQRGFEGGLLFSLGWSETEDYRNMPSFDELGSGERGHYYLSYPTDYQAYESIPEIRAEYDAMWSEISFVGENSLCYNFLLNK